ncbi:hypothetical protein FACS1894190_09970 [Spirochaetia bacterium]|nr:hypothetical protein FACS1894190_09970 [Spirochaetia bacterium]
MYKFFLKKSIFPVFLIICGNLFANPDVEYYQKSQIVQRLSWPAENDVFSYEIEIEKKEPNGWTPVVSEKTVEPYIELSLESAEYRYRVTVYDLLGRKRPSADWSSLRVLQALQPEVYSVSPGLFHIEDDQPVNIKITGKNLIKNSRIFLVSSEGKNIEPDKFSPEKNSEKAEISFDKNKLVSGSYAVKVSNPGGLETLKPGIVINHGKEAKGEIPVSDKKFSLSQGWGMLIPLNAIFARYFDMPFSPIGIDMHLSYRLFSFRFGKFGLDLSPSWSYLSAEHNDDLNGYWSVSAHMISISFNILYEAQFFNGRLRLDARIGGGLTFLADLRLFINEIGQRESLAGWIPRANALISVDFFVFNAFYVEAGVEFFMLFTGEALPIYLRPSVCVGWAF